ncbi:TPA: DUF1738 domain-containing protein [Klebsiella oxytoca]|nr:DUF1738 domain-containing protein [Klebsiella oxytoca]
MNAFHLQDAGDICRLLTDRLMHDVRHRDAPWHQDIIRHGLPINALSGQPFTGINVLLLWQAALRAGLTSPRWLTGEDLRSLGGRIRPGHRPATVVRYRPSLSLFRVINLEQCDGLPADLLPARPEKAADVARPARWLFTSGIPVVYREGVSPVWLPQQDRIELPMSPLTSEDTALLTALLIQATGHPERLARFGLTEGCDTTVEKLVADTGRAFLCARAGLFLDGPPLWDGVLPDDPWFLFRAATAAGKAADWLETRRQAQEPDDVQMWQQQAGALMANHYSLALDETLLNLDTIVRDHLARETSPRHAVSALARLYSWPRTDGSDAQGELFTPELSVATDMLASFTRDPGSLSISVEQGHRDHQPGHEVPPAMAPALLLPPPADTVSREAANDNDDPGPDNPPGQQGIASETGEDEEVPDNLATLPWVTNRGRPNPYRETFLRQFREIAPHENRWTIFSDLMHMSAAALHNRLAFSQEIEDDYLRRIRRYEEADRFRFQALFQTLIDGMDFSASDFLGSIYMELELGNHHNGQYFTPYSVSYTMAKMLMPGMKAKLDAGEPGYITVSDPACGAGSTIVALINVMLEAGYNPQKQMVAFCTDIDPVAAMMCYVQLSLCGIPAVVSVGNSLSMEIRQEWRTPFWMLQGWDIRWLYEQKRQTAQLRRTA